MDLKNADKIADLNYYSTRRNTEEFKECADWTIIPFIYSPTGGSPHNTLALTSEHPPHSTTPHTHQKKKLIFFLPRNKVSKNSVKLITMPKQMLVVRQVPDDWCQHRKDRLTKFNKTCESEFRYCRVHAKELKGEIKKITKSGFKEYQQVYTADQFPHVVEEKKLKLEQYKKSQIFFRHCQAGSTSTAQEKMNDLFEASVEWTEKILWLTDNNIMRRATRSFVDDDGVDRTEIIKGQEIYRQACDKEKELNDFNNSIIETLMDIWENDCCSTESADEDVGEENNMALDAMLGGMTNEEIHNNIYEYADPSPDEENTHLFSFFEYCENEEEWFDNLRTNPLTARKFLSGTFFDDMTVIDISAPSQLKVLTRSSAWELLCYGFYLDTENKTITRCFDGLLIRWLIELFKILSYMGYLESDGTFKFLLTQLLWVANKGQSKLFKYCHPDNLWKSWAISKDADISDLNLIMNRLDNDEWSIGFIEPQETEPSDFEDWDSSIAFQITADEPEETADEPVEEEIIEEEETAGVWGSKEGEEW